MLNLKEIKQKTEAAKSKEAQDLREKVRNYIINAADRGYNVVTFSAMMMDPINLPLLTIENYDMLYGELEKEGFKITCTHWNIIDSGGSTVDIDKQTFASIKIVW